ncbi:hypothetical protein ACMYR3_11585 [Ampullimonas aquatilis]
MMISPGCVIEKSRQSTQLESIKQYKYVFIDLMMMSSTHQPDKSIR